MKESTLKKNMAKYIRGRGGWARSMPGGPHGAGLPDLFFFYRGYGGGLEVKLPGKEHTLTKLQDETLHGIKSGGGIGRVVTSVKQVDSILNAIDRKRDAKHRTST